MNAHVPAVHFKMEGLPVVSQLAQPGDFMCTWDIKSAYHHIPLHEKSRHLLQFNLHNTHYQPNVLMFGYSLAPLVITKCFKEVLHFLRREHGIRLTVYIDDWIVFARSPSEAQLHRDIVTNLLLTLGLTLAPNKGVFHPSQKVRYLGFDIDTSADHVTLHLPEEKAAVIRSRASALLADARSRSRHTVWQSELMELTGMIAAASRALPDARLHSRELYNRIHSHHKGRVRLSAMAMADLEWFRSLQLPPTGRPIRPVRLLLPLRLSSDASGTGWGAVFQNREVHGGWRAEEQALHITAKETLAVLLALKTFSTQLSNQSVVLYCDNQSTVRIVNNGTSRSPCIMNAVRDIYQVVRTHEIDLHVRWVPSESNRADAPSRLRRAHDWQLRPEVFKAIEQCMGPHDVDLFSTRENALLPKFVSLNESPGALALDAFTLDWSQFHHPWVNPPFALIHRVLSHAILTKACITLLVPEWRSATWWALLCDFAARICVLPAPSHHYVTASTYFSEPLRNKGWSLLVCLIDCRRPPPRLFATSQPFPPLRLLC